MNIPPEYNGRRPWLQETYNNAKKGADYQEVLKTARRRSAEAEYGRNFWANLACVTAAGVWPLVYVIVAIVTPVPHSDVLAPCAVGCLITGMLAYAVAARFAEREFNPAAHKAEYERLRSLPADSDGVQRMPKEREFMVSPFGRAMHDLDRAELAIEEMMRARTRSACPPSREHELRSAELAAMNARNKLHQTIVMLEAAWQESRDMRNDAELGKIDAYARARESLDMVAQHMPFAILNHNAPTL